MWVSPRFVHPHAQNHRDVTLTLIQFAKVIWEGDAHAYLLGFGNKYAQNAAIPISL